MKRGAIVFTQELLKELLKERLPPDFKLCGVEFDAPYNNIKFHGYSEDFHETLEGNMHMNEANDGWIPLPLKATKRWEATETEKVKPFWKFW